MKLGYIASLDTLKEHYVKIKVTSTLARLLLGKKEVIYYAQESKIEKNSKKARYKRDKYQIISVLKQSLSDTLKEGKILLAKGKFLDVSKQKDMSHYEYVSKGKVKSSGDIKVKDNTLVSLIDTKNNLKIIKN